MLLGAIRIGIDPTIEIGPLTIAWHGLMIAAGIIAGGWLAGRYARRAGLPGEPLPTAVAALAFAGIAGAKLLYLIQEDAGALLRPADWVSSRGFSLYGGVIFGALGAALYIRRARLEARYLDALAAGFPLGLAIGRIGDLISGEHYGPPTDAPWGISYGHPHAEVPRLDVAYHSGALYEILLGVVMLALTLALWRRRLRTLELLWAVIGLYALGRFVIFFYRSDSDELALGLSESQWISIGLVAVSCAGALIARRRGSATAPRGPSYSPRGP